MTGLIAAEYIKLRKRTFFWVTAGLIWALNVLLAWISVQVTVGAESGGEGVTVSFSELIALFLTIQILGGEFADGRWAAGLTRDSRRGAHLLAKVVIAWVGLLFILVVSVLVGQSTSAVIGESVGELGELVEGLAKSSGVGLIWIMFGLAFSALFRAVGVSYIVGFIFYNADALVSLWDKYRSIAVSTNTSLFYGSEGGVLVLLVWGAVMAAASWALLKYRDA